jgi:hypothetical protein
VKRAVIAAALPRWIRPQLTQLVSQAPEGEQWLHEIKFDGYRMHARLDHGAVKLLTRTGLDWTHKYPAIAAAVPSLGARQAYLDGDLCGVGPDGVTSFSMIQLASDSGNAAALVFFLFDLLYVDSQNLLPRAAHRTGRRDLQRCCRMSRRPCTTAITTSAAAGNFISRPVRCRSRASSRSVPMRPTRPATAVCGSRSPAPRGIRGGRLD